MKRTLLMISIIFNILFLILIVRHFALMPKKEINNKVSYFTNRDKVLKGLSKSASDIFFVGDSYMQGFEVSELFNSVNYKNRGIYYDNSKGVLGRSADIGSGKPSKVVIEVGINDLENGNPLDSIRANVFKTITAIRIKSPKTKIILLSVLPTSLKFGEPLKSIENDRIKLNTFYSQIAASNNSVYINLDFYFLDQGLKMQYDGGDKVHLNAAGYLKLSEILKPYLIK